MDVQIPAGVAHAGNAYSHVPAGASPDAHVGVRVDGARAVHPDMFGSRAVGPGTLPGFPYPQHCGTLHDR
jgi:hypothetical protein